MRNRRRPVITISLLIGGAVIVVGLALSMAPDGGLFMTQDPQQKPATSESPEVDVERGELTTLYFSEFEIRDAGLNPERFDLNNVPYRADLDLENLKLGCPRSDCIASIDEPRFGDAETAEAWLEADDLVMGVDQDGVAKAYPLRILNHHEIVNDRLNGQPIAVTYCPLCHSGLTFLRPTTDGTVLTFGVSGRLYKSDLVMYDRQTATFWTQLTGNPIVGPLVGEAPSLERVATDLAPWSSWRERHPDTQVLQRPSESWAVGGRPPEDPNAPSDAFLKDYERDPYKHYRRNDAHVETEVQDRRLSNKANVRGLVIDGTAKAYAVPELREQAVLNDRVDDRAILAVAPPDGAIRFFDRTIAGRAEPLAFEWTNDQLVDRATGSTWSSAGLATAGPLKGTQLAELDATSSFWFAWALFHPDTAVYPSEEEASASDDASEGSED